MSPGGTHLEKGGRSADSSLPGVHTLSTPGSRPLAGGAQRLTHACKSQPAAAAAHSALPHASTGGKCSHHAHPLLQSPLTVEPRHRPPVLPAPEPLPIQKRRPCWPAVIALISSTLLPKKNPASAYVAAALAEGTGESRPQLWRAPPCAARCTFPLRPATPSCSACHTPEQHAGGYAPDAALVPSHHADILSPVVPAPQKQQRPGFDLFRNLLQLMGAIPATRRRSAASHISAAPRISSVGVGAANSRHQGVALPNSSAPLAVSLLLKV